MAKAWFHTTLTDTSFGIQGEVFKLNSEGLLSPHPENDETVRACIEYPHTELRDIPDSPEKAAPKAAPKAATKKAAAKKPSKKA
jgi:hypothetical protein